MSEFNLSGWALKNRPLVVYLMIVAVLAGVSAFIGLGRNEDPAFTIKTMVVQAAWPGASLDETAKQVTERIERKLQELPGLDTLRSFTRAGVTTVFVDLKGEVTAREIPAIWQRVRNDVADIRPTLPAGVLGPFFNDRFGDTFGIIYGFTADGFTQRELRDHVEDVRSRLLHVPDVSVIEILGAQDEVIFVEFSIAHVPRQRPARDRARDRDARRRRHPRTGPERPARDGEDPGRPADRHRTFARGRPARDGRPRHRRVHDLALAGDRHHPRGELHRLGRAARPDRGAGDPAHARDRLPADAALQHRHAAHLLGCAHHRAGAAHRRRDDHDRRHADAARRRRRQGGSGKVRLPALRLRHAGRHPGHHRRLRARGLRARSSAGEYTFSLFAVVTIALLVSWVVAVIFAPLLGLAILMPPPRAANAEPPRVVRWYLAFLNRALRLRWLTIAMTVALFVGSILLLPLIPRQFFPSSDRPELVVDLTLPQNASIFASETTAARVDKLLEGGPDVVRWSTYVGRGAIRFYLPLNVQLPNDFFSQAVIVAKDVEARERPRAKLETALAEGFPEVVGRIYPLELGPPVAWPVQYRVSGPDPNRLRAVALDVAQSVAGSPGTEKVNFDGIEPAREVRIRIDQDQVRLLGLSSDAVSGVLNTVLARATDEQRVSLSTLPTLQVPLPNGRTVPLSQFATFEHDQAFPLLWRRDRVPTLTVQADVVPGTLPESVVAELNAGLPEPYRAWSAGRARKARNRKPW